MGKYDSMKVLKATVSHTDQVCAHCKQKILAGDRHHREALTDKKINFIGKRFHINCGDNRDPERPRIEDFG